MPRSELAKRCCNSGRASRRFGPEGLGEHAPGSAAVPLATGASGNQLSGWIKSWSRPRAESWRRAGANCRAARRARRAPGHPHVRHAPEIQVLRDAPDAPECAGQRHNRAGVLRIPPDQSCMWTPDAALHRPDECAEAYRLCCSAASRLPSRPIKRCLVSTTGATHPGGAEIAAGTPKFARFPCRVERFREACLQRGDGGSV